MKLTRFSARTDAWASKVNMYVEMLAWRFDLIIPPILDILPHLHLAADIVHLIPLKD